jgi:hypothetical protein
VLLRFDAIKGGPCSPRSSGWPRLPLTTTTTAASYAPLFAPTPSSALGRYLRRTPPLQPSVSRGCPNGGSTGATSTSLCWPLTSLGACCWPYRHCDLRHLALLLAEASVATLVIWSCCLGRAALLQTAVAVDTIFLAKSPSISSFCRFCYM